MKKIILIVFIFTCFTTPCFTAEIASQYFIDRTEWTDGSGATIGFYQQDIWLCDSYECHLMPNSWYGRIFFRGSVCGDQCGSIKGCAFPSWSFGFTELCINSCITIRIIKVSDSFTPLPASEEVSEIFKMEAPANIRPSLADFMQQFAK